MYLKRNSDVLLCAVENLRKSACTAKDGQSWVNLEYKEMWDL